MAQYIDKSVLVAEIERRLKVLYKDKDFKYLQIKELEALLSFLNTLEVKEVDLEKEIQDHIKECLDIKFPTTDIELIKKDVAYTAKKFFELGLKVKQESNDEVKIGETQIYFNDTMRQPYVDELGLLDLSCMKYEILKTLFNDGDNVEILIRKAQKGE